MSCEGLREDSTAPPPSGLLDGSDTGINVSERYVDVVALSVDVDSQGSFVSEDLLTV